MNALLSALGTGGLIVVLSFQVASDEPKQVKPIVKVSPLGDLLSTLKRAYRLRFSEYKGGVAASVNVIRVNKDLYDAERRIIISGRETESQENFVSRARDIEQVAEARLANGTGSEVDFLDARAARLQAEMTLSGSTKSK